MKNSKKGISLIVLIITIIVIVILATAILVSVLTNNPISEANKARYESDRDNMQAVFTNTVGKIMAENQGVVNVTACQINTEVSGVNETTGEVTYTVDNATVAENASGTIKFDKGTNDATTYYTGKKLPIYAAGETKWYVDSEGVLSLEVAGVKYGSNEVESNSTVTYNSLDNWQHQLKDGTIEDHKDENTDGICDVCNCNEIPGIYQPDGKFVSWEQLTSTEYKSFNVLYDYEEDEEGNLIEVYKEFAILNVDEKGTLSYANSMETDECLSDPYLVGKLVIDDSVKILYSPGNFLYPNTTLESIIIPYSVTKIYNFSESCHGLKSVSIDEKNLVYDSRNNCNGIIETETNTLIQGCDGMIVPETVKTIGDSAFYHSYSLTNITLSDGLENIGGDSFFDCINLKTIYIPSSVITMGESWRGYGPFTDCSDDLKIYCELSQAPDTWGEYWNYNSSKHPLDVTYGVTREQYEAIIAE